MANAVLIPLDGSTFAEAALPQGVAVAARMQATVHLVRVRTAAHLPAGDLVAVAPEDLPPLHRYLDDVAARVRCVFDGPIRTHVLEGPPAEALERFAEERGIALVAMSTHGSKGLLRFRLGSTADKLLHHLRAPVLLVRPAEDGVVVTPVAPGCRRVLLALDGSALAASMLPTAEAFAATWRAPITLVRVVVPPPPPVPVSFNGLVVPIPDVSQVEPLVQAARAELQPYVERLAVRGCEADAHVEVGLTAAEGLRAVAARTPGAVLAIATHGYSGLRRLLRGSTADAVLRDAPVPLLVWRPAPAMVDEAMEREASLAQR